MVYSKPVFKCMLLSFELSVFLIGALHEASGLRAAGLLGTYSQHPAVLDLGLGSSGVRVWAWGIGL